MSIHKAASGATVSTGKTPTTYGEPVTFTATVTGSGGTPSGSVTFNDGVTPIGSANLNASGQASLTTAALVAASHTITAAYAGNNNFNGVTSQGIPQVVAPSATATVFASSVNPSVFAQPVTFTVQVSLIAPGAGLPTGTVTFRDGSDPLSTVPVNGSGQAAITTSSLALGPHSITATYNGDANTTGSASSTLNQVVYTYSGAGGSFVIGDTNAVVGQQVTFWSSQWEKTNTLSGSGQLPGFKGFAGSTVPNPPAAGGTWSSAGVTPPPTVPAYMAVIATSSADKSGSDFSGNVVKIVIVRVDPGYEGSPGHDGTGTVIAILP